MSTPEPVKSAGRHVHMQAGTCTCTSYIFPVACCSSSARITSTFEILSTALRVVHPPRTLIPALEMSAIEESSHAER